MFNYFLGVALVAAPFFIKMGARTTTNVSQEFFLIFSTLVMFFIFGIKKIHLNLKILGLMVAGLSFITHNPFGVSQYYQWMLSISGVVFMMIVCSYAHDIKIKTIEKSFAIICVLESAWIFFQYFGISLHNTWFNLLVPNGHIQSLNNSAIFGSMGNINHGGALIAVTIPFLPIYLWPIPFIALYLGNGALPVICAVIAIIALYSYRREIYLPLKIAACGLFMSALAMVGGLFTEKSFFYGSGRVEAWKLALKDSGISIFGKGLGYVPEIFSKKEILGEHYFQLHNEWLELYVVAGLLGVVVGVYLILPIFKNRGNPAINACAIALLVNSLGNFTFHIAPLFMVFGTCYALQLAKE